MQRFVSSRSVLVLGFALSVALQAGPASADGLMRITEWMYNGDEFIEFTNVGNAAVDLSGWSFDDDSRTPGVVALGAFGMVDPGESVLLTEASAATFRAAWGLAATVSVIGDNTTNLGRPDELNLFDASNALVDRLTYNDQTIGGPRTQNLSANILPANLGANQANLAVASFVGDAFGSKLSTSAYPGNPGTYVPEPGVAALLALGAAGLSVARRRG